MSYVGVNWQLLSEHVFVCQSQKILHRMLADWLVFTTTQDLSTYHFIPEKIEGKGVKKRRNEGGGQKDGVKIEAKWESERIWGEGAMKLVTGVPVTCQQLVLAARAGKACVWSVCMYTCVWGCVSDGSVCVYVAVRPISIYKALSYTILDRTRGETGEREGCAHFQTFPHFLFQKKQKHLKPCLQLDSI